MAIALRDEPVRQHVAARTARGVAARPTRTRVHSGVATRIAHVAGGRPMVRATFGIEVGPARPALVVVPRRRRAARLVAVVFAAVFALMFAAATFQTQLARRQLTIDKIDRSIRDANEQYSRLRQQRSELRSPALLAKEAAALGMKPATDTKFMTVAPDVVAAVQQSAGGVFSAGVGDRAAVLDEFMKVKSIAGETP